MPTTTATTPAEEVQEQRGHKQPCLAHCGHDSACVLALGLHSQNIAERPSTHTMQYKDYWNLEHPPSSAVHEGWQQPPASPLVTCYSPMMPAIGPALELEPPEDGGATGAPEPLLSTGFGDCSVPGEVVMGSSGTAQTSKQQWSRDALRNRQKVPVGCLQCNLPESLLSFACGVPIIDHR